MQTFLPYPDFEATARVLDARRLGKQQVEALQILRALTRPQCGWKHHPAVRMWVGHQEALAAYGAAICAAICAEWCRQGHALLGLVGRLTRAELPSTLRPALGVRHDDGVLKVLGGPQADVARALAVSPRLTVAQLRLRTACPGTPVRHSFPTGVGRTGRGTGGPIPCPVDR